MKLPQRWWNEMTYMCLNKYIYKYLLIAFEIQLKNVTNFCSDLKYIQAKHGNVPSAEVSCMIVQLNYFGLFSRRSRHTEAVGLKGPNLKSGNHSSY